MKLTFTDKARDMVTSFMDVDEDGLQALRIAVEGSPFAPNYELTLVEAEARSASDVEVDAGAFTVLVDEASVKRLDGARVDFVETIQESGFQITPDPDAVKDAMDEAGPGGALAERVTQVLDAEINPAIAAHGGVINLVDVQGTEIFIEMAGGCQGCAMSRMTLRQGVERMVSQSVPEVTAIHDVTDHASGDNPYFT
ncbi:MAG: iron-sulfur cluster assembly accessory protein [Gemmatimonadetes bacterium]|nr:iron-sulfur cluster assembly accessory protein [Gemmatimonadota bacterium]MXX73007.1 iron-sulfur cluster assembly accessory protein [Gemmatimonadota bacterium]MYC92732.1 iron-sulfur cluster assembly accessory protein [Gemmatimonadota bacterium]MYG34429.1 iron-sulfur cluster assembly accessory protein [Gemmatimonadota bacterium]MYJ16481.1 iron-sulfur cluster assembly accessory protein [Gemmatimonadota bacterium]